MQIDEFLARTGQDFSTPDPERWERERLTETEFLADRRDRDRPRHVPRPRLYDHDEVRRLRATGMSAQKIAERLGCKRNTVYQILGR